MMCSLSACIGKQWCHMCARQTLKIQKKTDSHSHTTDSPHFLLVILKVNIKFDDIFKPMEYGAFKRS